jgi:hypothetical protein
MRDRFMTPDVEEMVAFGAAMLTAWCPETRPSRFGIELVTQESPMTK